MKVSSVGTTWEGNLVDKQIVDIYSIGINANGQLVSSLNSEPIDHSNALSMNAALNFFTNFNDISNDVKTNVQAFASSKLHNMPISTVQNYLLPGGKTFALRVLASRIIRI